MTAFVVQRANFPYSSYHAYLGGGGFLYVEGVPLKVSVNMVSRFSSYFAFRCRDEEAAKRQRKRFAD